MAIWTVIRARGWLPGIISTVVCCLMGASAGNMSMGAIAADGQRRFGQALIVLHPAIAATGLVDRIPSISASLLKEMWVVRVAVLGYWLSILAVAMCVVSSLGLLSPDSLYLGSMALSFGAIASVGVVSWASLGLLGHVVIGLSWLSAATTIAEVLGFGAYPAPPPPMFYQPAWWAPIPHLIVPLVAAGMLLFRPQGLSTRSGCELSGKL